MLSRVAFTTYWMSRFMERAENVARFINVNHHLALDLPLDEETQWGPLVTVTGDWEEFRRRYGYASQENVIQFLTFDPDYPNSIYSCIRQARENARTVREAISSELWEVLNQLYLDLQETAAQERAIASPHDFFEEVRRECSLFTGLAVNTMTRNEAWHFIRLGQLLERADKTSRMLDVKYFLLLPEPNYVGTPYDSIQWSAVLKSTSALEMYRLSYQRISPTDVVQFLVLNPEFPRAIRYCVAHAETCLHKISGSQPGSYCNPAEQALGRLRAQLDFADTREMFEHGLHEYLDDLQLKLNRAGDSVYDTFFALPAVEPLVPSHSSQFQYQ
ncbi:MAG: alpha-E domain-containing protein [Candidatus Hydrogenedentes bacterium]|nr:alpha-E domain-containing protein [Candidatus Hydrogenedentota bacterium]